MVPKSEDDRRRTTSSAHRLSRNDTAPNQVRRLKAAVPLRKTARHLTCAEMLAVDPLDCTVLDDEFERVTREARCCWLRPLKPPSLAK